MENYKITIKDKYSEIEIISKNLGVVSVIIDTDRIEFVKKYSWHITTGTTKYVKCKKGFLHRLLVNCPSDKVVDHINHNPFDNRVSNLRICTQHENGQNRVKNINNKSGVTGVSWCNSKNKWTVQIGHKGKKIMLGSFDDIETAKDVRLKAEKELWQHKNALTHKLVQEGVLSKEEILKAFEEAQ